MTYAAAITALKSTIEGVSISGSSLAYTTDTRRRRLAKASRAQFDGSYLLRSEGGGSLYRELAANPSAFMDTITLEIGTELTTDASAADGVSVLRGQKILEAVLTSNISGIIDIQPLGEPVKSSDDRRIVWSQRFRIIYAE